VLALVLALAACDGSDSEQRLPALQPDPFSAPWLREPSPFPDPLPEPAAAPAPVAAPTPEPTTARDAGPPRRSWDDIGLPALPEGFSVPRLPRPGPDNPEVPREPPPGTGPLVRIGGSVEISRERYNDRVQRSLDAFHGMTGHVPRNVWRNVVGGTLLVLIERAIDETRAKELGVEVSEAAVDEELQRFVADRGGPGMFPRFLKHMGITEETVREDLRAKVLHRQLMAKAIGEIEVRPEDIEETYQRRRAEFAEPRRRHLRHILVRLPEDRNSANMAVAVAKAERVLKVAQVEGADFEAIAKRHSEGATAKRGGLLGWLKRGQMPDAFDQVAFSMRCPGVTGIISTELGLHIIECAGERQGRWLPLDEALRARIRGRLHDRRRRKRRAEINRAWYQEAPIEYLDATVAELAAEVRERTQRKGQHGRMRGPSDEGLRPRFTPPSAPAAPAAP